MRLFLPALLSCVTLACSGPSKVCSPGLSIACVGPAGCNGGQQCNADGSGYGACDCGSGGAGGQGGAGGSGGVGGAGGTGGGTPWTVQPDGGIPCNLFAGVCPVGTRCGFVPDVAGAGAGMCVPAGTGGALAPCTSAAGEADSCGAGLVCAGWCKHPCDTADAGSCAAGYLCGRYSMFAGPLDSVGLCEPTCDPVTQQRVDGAPACGSTDGGTRLGCYGPVNGNFICAMAGAATNTHRVEITGNVYLNSCAPGFGLMSKSSAVPTTMVCTAYCAPAPTNTSLPGNVHGVSPHTCADRGADAGCRYLWWITGDPPGPEDSAGFCIDDGLYTYDHDNNPNTAQIFWPTCDTVSPVDTNGNSIPDYQELGCGPRP